MERFLLASGGKLAGCMKEVLVVLKVEASPDLTCLTIARRAKKSDGGFFGEMRGVEFGGIKVRTMHCKATPKHAHHPLPVCSAIQAIIFMPVRRHYHPIINLICRQATCIC